MNNANNTPELNNLEGRSTEELKAMLQADIDGERELSPETLDELLSILRSRNAIPVPSPQETQEAWERFKNRHILPEAEQTKPNKSPKWKYLWLQGCVAAVLACVLLLFVPATLGTENNYNVIARWTDEVFYFESFTGVAPPAPTDYVYSTDYPELQRVYHAANAAGVSRPVVPTWIPRGFTLAELRTDATHNRSRVAAGFLRENEVILFSLTKASWDETVTTLYTKSPGEPELITRHGITYYVFRDDTQWKCVWAIDDLMCTISADVSREQLLKIIDSIYESLD